MKNEDHGSGSISRGAGAVVSKTGMPKRFWTLAVFCAFLPGAEVPGIPCGHFSGHLPDRQSFECLGIPGPSDRLQST